MRGKRKGDGPLVFLFCLVIVVFVFFVVLAVAAVAPSKHQIKVGNPPGENATTPTTPAPTTTTTSPPPQIKFVTTAQGANEFGKFIWHGTIDGIECLIYADKMFCKGMTEVANGVTPP